MPIPVSGDLLLSRMAIAKGPLATLSNLKGESLPVRLLRSGSHKLGVHNLLLAAAESRFGNATAGNWCLSDINRSYTGNRSRAFASVIGWKLRTTSAYGTRATKVC